MRRREGARTLQVQAPSAPRSGSAQSELRRAGSEERPHSGNYARAPSSGDRPRTGGAPVSARASRRPPWFPRCGPQFFASTPLLSCHRRVGHSMTRPGGLNGRFPARSAPPRSSTGRHSAAASHAPTSAPRTPAGLASAGRRGGNRTRCRSRPPRGGNSRCLGAWYRYPEPASGLLHIAPSKTVIERILTVAPNSPKFWPSSSLRSATRKPAPFPWSRPTTPSDAYGIRRHRGSGEPDQQYRRAANFHPCSRPFTVSMKVLFSVAIADDG